MSSGRRNWVKPIVAVVTIPIKVLCSSGWLGGWLVAQFHTHIVDYRSGKWVIERFGVFLSMLPASTIDWRKAWATPAEVSMPTGYHQWMYVKRFEQNFPF